MLNHGVNEFDGWLRVTLPKNVTPGMIHNWAFYDGASFTFAQIPVSGAALLGGLGLLMLLRRRQQLGGCFTAPAAETS